MEYVWEEVEATPPPRNHFHLEMYFKFITLVAVDFVAPCSGCFQTDLISVLAVLI